MQGGTDVGVWINKRNYSSPALLSLGKIASLFELHEEGGTITAGANVTLSQFPKFEAQLKEEAHWERVRDEVQVKLISIPGGQETFILCKTEGRQQKEQVHPESIRDTHRAGAGQLEEAGEVRPAEES